MRSARSKQPLGSPSFGETALRHKNTEVHTKSNVSIQRTDMVDYLHAAISKRTP
jgi:hypothetical protein